MGGILSTGIPRNVLFAVSDEKSAANHVSIALEDCFDCPEWRDLVKQCKNKLFLVASTFEEFNSLPNARVLSYRWKEVKETKCRVTIPGRSPSGRRSCIFCVDAFDYLKDFSEGYLWIDYLCHLNDSAHKVHVMGQMGSLYWKGEVLAGYLLNVDMTEEVGSKSDCIDGKFFDDIKVKKQFSPTLLALRRGWIQQEISFGKLDPTVVKGFVAECIKNQYYGVLGTLIRRRTKAMKWVFTEYDELETTLLFLDTTEVNMAQQSNGLLGKSMSLGEVSIDVQNAIRDFISAAVSNISPSHHNQIVSAGKERRSTLSQKLHTLYAEEEAKAKKEVGKDVKFIHYFNHSDELQVLTSEVWDLDQKNGFDLDMCGLEVRDEVLAALQPFLDTLTSNICEPGALDPSDFFCAFQLLRSFGESELTYESDVKCALTQVAAVSAGMVWESGDKGSTVSGTSLDLLQTCWKTVFNHVLSNSLHIRVGIVRKDVTAKTMGLMKLLSFFKTATFESKSGYLCDSLVIVAGHDSISVFFVHPEDHGRLTFEANILTKIDDIFSA